MLDNFAREINYLRISVTDRCNFRCIYCMPAEGVPMVDRKEILALEEMSKLIRSFARIGIKKIRLTGGEPLVRKGIVDLVKDIAEISGIDDIALTTNGVLLPAYAAALRTAGLKRVNVSLDTLRDDRFEEITRGGKLEDVWSGIKAAWAEGFEPVKTNTVIVRGFNDDEIIDFVKLTETLPLHIRFIELMPIGISDKFEAEKFVPIDEIRQVIEKQYQLRPARTPTGSGPAKYYTIGGAVGTVGFISALSNHFCGSCNRLRLTSDGRLRPCLQSPVEVDLKGPLRRGADEEKLARIIQEAVSTKPDGHNMNSHGWGDNRRTMSQIGG